MRASRGVVLIVNSQVLTPKLLGHVLWQFYPVQISSKSAPIRIWIVKSLLDATGWASCSPHKCGRVLRAIGTAFWMGVAIVGTMSIETGIVLPLTVSISTVVTGSFWCSLDVVPNDAREIFADEVGDMPNSLTMSTDIKEYWAPSSKKIFALVLLLPAITGATAVLSKQVVANCGKAQGDAWVRSSVTSCCWWSTLSSFVLWRFSWFV